MVQGVEGDYRVVNDDTEIREVKARSGRGQYNISPMTRDLAAGKMLCIEDQTEWQRVRSYAYNQQGYLRRHGYKVHTSSSKFGPGGYIWADPEDPEE